MARLVFGVALLLAGFAGSAWAQTPALQAGVVTANNVDVTTDSGEVLPERLHVGDSVYIVSKPPKARKGWVRVSRTPEDTVGVGWIEEKNVRSFKRYSNQAPSDTPTAAEPDVGESDLLLLPLEPNEPSAAPAAAAPASRVIVVAPFSSSLSKDPLREMAQSAFAGSFRQQGGFEVSSPATEGVDLNSEDAVRGLAEKSGAEGVFVGTISPPLGKSRLLKIRYFQKDKGAFVMEKVKKLPSQGNITSAVEELATSCAREVSAQ